MRVVAIAVAFASITALATTASADDLDGNELLARSALLNPWPASYSVPLHFSVRMHRPLPIRFGANATVYFRAPDQQAVDVTSVPRPIARFISRNYGKLDTIPQAWPGKYHVTAVAHVDHDGVPAYRLDATPAYAGDITHVTFDLLVDDLTPVGAAWYFKDGSTVRLTVANQRLGGYVLPQHEKLALVMPKYALDADADAGRYSLDAVIPAGVFEQP